MEKNRLKFRAWDGEQMRHSFAIASSGETLMGGEEYNDWIVMQFTGLHDKNGKEIYEGDIVKDHYCEYSDDSFTVKFYNGAFYPMVQVKEGYNCILKYDKEQFEIIGNIYETTPTNNI